jgi:phosphoenolpyruvate carboxylase
MADTYLAQFHDEVVLKYHLYNGLFLTLPFGDTETTGTLLSVFAKYCQQAITRGKSPHDIIDGFFKQQLQTEDEQIKIAHLFGMLQFVERQVLLFDALEDAAFALTHNLSSQGSLQHLINQVQYRQQQQQFLQQIRDYRIRLVLTAHPTQFYPPPILTILTQLTQALRQNDFKQISLLLLQMGKTSFKHRQKPTPYEEAHSLIWYLENTFYTVVPQIQQAIDQARQEFATATLPAINCIDVGFWPGGDRDGNPNVTPEITLQVAQLLKTRILRLYLQDLRQLVKKLTFGGVLEKLEAIRNKLEQTHLAAQLANHQKSDKTIYQTAHDLLRDLNQLRTLLITKHNSLFLENLDEFITKVRCFGFYFAAMDMRENANIHRQVFSLLLEQLAKNNKHAELRHYETLPIDKKIALLKKLVQNQTQLKLPLKNAPSQLNNCLTAISIISQIQQQNGEQGLNRYVISNTGSALDVLELLALCHTVGNFGDKISLDIVPLFESIADLEHATHSMQQLYECDFYRKHLKQRQSTQIVMLGFSDGTKDGGYVTANWSIYKAKAALTALSDQYGVNVIFFDGRGGPPGRGGGNTHAFYRSLGSKIKHNQPQLTVQGQTISAHFGTAAIGKYNLEQLFTAGLEDLISPEQANDLTTEDTKLLEQLSQASLKAYLALKNDPLFVAYLEHMTPLHFYSELNVGSRPSSRSKSKQLEFGALRAIPFVGSWSQLKQNVPGYYGFGTALQQLIQQGKKSALQTLYQRSLFFRTLVENAMMSLSKSFFPLTAYMRKDKKFGKFWQQLAAEAALTKKLLLEISGQSQLLENDALNRESIKLREEIVLPLLIIQQFAMMRHSELITKDSAAAMVYQKMIIKALAANTNASRNSA